MAGKYNRSYQSRVVWGREWEGEGVGFKLKTDDTSANNETHLIQISSNRRSELSPEFGSFLQATSILCRNV